MTQYLEIGDVIKLSSGEIIRVVPSPSSLLGLHFTDCSGCYMEETTLGCSGYSIQGFLNVVNCRAPRGCHYELVEEAVDETDAGNNTSKDSPYKTGEDSNLVESRDND